MQWKLPFHCIKHIKDEEHEEHEEHEEASISDYGT